MKLLRLFLAFYIGLILNLAFFLLYGEAGLKEYAGLLLYRQRLEENLGDLKDVNWHLTQELRSLGTDPDRISTLSRDLGYFKRDERVIRLDGFSTRRRYYEAGRLVRGFSNRTDAFLFFRVLSLVVPALIYIVSGFFLKEAGRGNTTGRF